MTMKIGENIDLGVQPLLLAPMEDVTVPSFRWVCKEFGADMMYTEFISSDGLVRDARKSLEKLKTYDFEAPTSRTPFRSAGGLRRQVCQW